MERIENKIEKRNNKKNVQKKVLMVAGLALLLGFVGYTGGTTYAKYVTSATPVSKEATVAKWGYTVSLDAANLFGPEYVDDNDTTKDVSVITGTTGAGSTVTIQGSTNLVAPGATGSFELHINGSSEVLSQLTVTASGDDVFLNDYHPIVWTVEKIGDSVDAPNWAGADGIITTAELVSGLNGLTSVNVPGATLNYDYKLTWSWAFSQSHDSEDTTLGQLANNPTLPGETTPYPADKYSTDFSINVSVNLEQLAE